MRLHDLFEIGGKVTRVAGDNLELDGGAVKIDLKKFDIDMEDPNKPKLKKKKRGFLVLRLCLKSVVLSRSAYCFYLLIAV